MQTAAQESGTEREDDHEEASAESSSSLDSTAENANAPAEPRSSDDESVSGQAISETLRSKVRTAERGINSEEVIENADNVYYDDNGNQIFVWEQDDRRSQVTIRDPSNGNIVTNQWSTNAWVQRQVDKERWYSLND